MKKLKELIGMAEEPHIITLDYHKTLEEWCEEMSLSETIKQSVMSSQLVLLPMGYRDSPMAFSIHTSDFSNYCKNRGLRIEICCNEDEFTQLELCSVKVRLGKILAPSAISGVIIWNIVSGYIKESIDTIVKDEVATDQVVETPAFQAEPECSFSVILRDTTGKYIEVKYDGPISGMEEAGNQIKNIAGDGK